MSLRTRTALGAATAIATGAAVALAACAKSDGVRVEGSAPADAAKPAATSVPLEPPSAVATPEAVPTSSPVEQDPAVPTLHTGPAPVPKVDVVKLLKSDPAVRVKKALQACSGDGESYPLETTFAALTGSDASDLVVNVSTCSDGLGIGSYVYQYVDGRYVNVFAAEQPQVWAQLSTEGTLEVTQQNYQESDPVYDPSSETVTTYRWNGQGFDKVAVARNNYGK